MNDDGIIYLVLLAGICFCVHQIWRKKQPDDE